MKSLAYSAHTYWCAARRIRSGTADSRDTSDLMVILRNAGPSESLFRGIVDAMDEAIDQHVPLNISDDDARELGWAIAERDDMEEARWAKYPSFVLEGEPEVCSLTIAKVVGNG